MIVAIFFDANAAAEPGIQDTTVTHQDIQALFPRATRIGDYTQLVLIRATGEDRRVLTDHRWRNCEDPSWAPDGRHVVFTSDRNGTPKLYVMDVLEGGVRQLTFGEEPDITPAWSRQ